MFRNISNPSIQNDGNNNSSATYPSFGGNQTKFKFTLAKNNINENNNNDDQKNMKNNNEEDENSNSNNNSNNYKNEMKRKKNIQNKLQGKDNDSSKGNSSTNKRVSFNSKDGDYNPNNKSKQNINSNTKKGLNSKTDKNKNKSSNNLSGSSNNYINNQKNQQQNINNKRNSKNIVISPSSNNEIKYNLKKNNNGKQTNRKNNNNLNKGNNDNNDNDDSNYEEDEQSRRIDKLINSIRTNQNTIRKSYGMPEIKVENQRSSSNNMNNKINVKLNDLIQSGEKGNFYYNAKDGNKKYMLLYFCYLVCYYMKRKVFLLVAKHIANYQKFLEKKFALKILYRVLKKRIIFYKIKFLHRYKKIYKYLYKNNIETISQIYSDESSSCYYDSEKNNYNKITQKNNKVENRNNFVENKNKVKTKIIVSKTNNDKKGKNVKSKK